MRAFFLARKWKDDHDLARPVKMGLGDEGWRVEHAAGGATGRARAASGEHDLGVAVPALMVDHGGIKYYGLAANES